MMCSSKLLISIYKCNLILIKHLRNYCVAKSYLVKEYEQETPRYDTI